MKLDKHVMEKFGFKAVWPQGNPTEQWWENEKLKITFFGLPTDKEFIAEFIQRGEEEAKCAIREKFEEFKESFSY